MSRPRLLVFASGTKSGGGSGFENLVRASRNGVLSAYIVAVVSSCSRGGVERRAFKLGVPFIHLSAPWTAEKYQNIVKWLGADFVALSGWLKLVEGLDPKTTFNIHPGPLPEFGGPGMYGHHVHEAVLKKSFCDRQFKHSAVSMHFATAKYDDGPVFFQYKVPIINGDTAEELGKRVNEIERRFQPIITDMVVRGEIFWNGKDKDSLQTPNGHSSLP